MINPGVYGSMLQGFHTVPRFAVSQSDEASRIDTVGIGEPGWQLPWKSYDLLKNRINGTVSH